MDGCLHRHSREKAWSVLRVTDSFDTYSDNDEPRPVTRHLINVLESMTEEDFRMEPKEFVVFAAHVESARKERSRIIEDRKKFKVPLLLAESKRQQFLADIMSSASAESLE